MHRSLILFFILFIFKTVFGQDTLLFELKANRMNLGEVVITKTDYSNSDSIKYELESLIEVWSIYKIHYSMESVYNNDTLLRTSSIIKVNSEINHKTVTHRTDSGYSVKSTKGDTVIYKNAIFSSVTPYYFKPYSGPDSIFSEYSGRFRPFIRKNDSTYILDPKDPLEFIFNEKQITKVVVPNSIMNFYIELKK